MLKYKTFLSSNASALERDVNDWIKEDDARQIISQCVVIDKDGFYFVSVFYY